MTRKQSIFFGVVLFILVSATTVLLIQDISPQGRDIFSFVRQKNISSESLNRQENNIFLVQRVVDGDTIMLENGKKVRYIGMNTPESVDPKRKVECFGKEAAAYNKNLVEGKMVRLERDISDYDKYGRLLRFVYLEDGTLVNELLVRNGYALVSTYPPDVAKQDIFQKAEQEAHIEKRGLWSEATCSGKK